MGDQSRARPSFDEVFDRVRGTGEDSVTSSRGTPNRVSAVVARDGRRTLIARPRSGQVRIHEDCWGDELTCQRTRAGGVYKARIAVLEGDPNGFTSICHDCGIDAWGFEEDGRTVTEEFYVSSELWMPLRPTTRSSAGPPRTVVSSARAASFPASVALSGDSDGR